MTRESALTGERTALLADELAGVQDEGRALLDSKESTVRWRVGNRAATSIPWPTVSLLSCFSPTLLHLPTWVARDAKPGKKARYAGR